MMIMFKQQLLMTLLMMTVANVFGGIVNFTDCGNKEVKQVKISGCNSSNTCVVHQGDKVTLEIDFEANENTEGAIFSIEATFDGTQYQIPLSDSNVCHSVQCPLVQGQLYKYTLTQVIPDSIPSLSTEVTAKITSISDYQLMICVIVDVEIESN